MSATPNWAWYIIVLCTACEGLPSIIAHKPSGKGHLYSILEYEVYFMTYRIRIHVYIPLIFFYIYLDVVGHNLFFFFLSQGLTIVIYGFGFGLYEMQALVTILHFFVGNILSFI